MAEQYNLSIKDATDARKLFSKEEILQLAEFQGYQKEEIADLKKELK